VLRLYAQPRRKMPAIIYYMTGEVSFRTPPPPAPTRPELDAALERLAGRKDAWVRVEIAERVRYLMDCLECLGEVAPKWVREACLHRGIDPDSTLAGEEWLSGPMVTAQALRLFASSLEQNGRPRPRRVRVTDDGQTVVTVFPGSLLDRFLYYNMSAEIWIEPGKEASQGRIYRQKEAGRFPPGKVGLVLGAGNISSIPPLDVLHKLLVDDEVVMLKTNPVNAYLGPFLGDLPRWPRRRRLPLPSPARGERAPDRFRPNSRRDRLGW
jgi:hypothetical protein